MPNTVNLSCECGAVNGQLTINPSSSFHVQCLCCDCQRFAAYLGNEDKLLDKHGGSELFQTYPKHMKITQGQEHISCIKLHEKGLYRWYTTCCNMPMANTMTNPKIPFVGIFAKFMKFESEQDKNDKLGPVVVKAFGKYAKGAMPKDAHERFPLSFLPKIAIFMLKGFIGKKHSPSPFFHDGEPIVKSPKVIGAE